MSIALSGPVEYFLKHLKVTVLPAGDLNRPKHEKKWALTVLPEVQVKPSCTQTKEFWGLDDG